MPSRPAEQKPDRRAIARRHELQRVGGQPLAREPLDHRGVDGARGTEAFRAAAQDHGVAGLDRQGAGIGGDVGAALIDDGDDAERRAHALDFQPVRPLPARDHLADRIGHGGDGLDAVGHGGDALVVEQEAVDEGGRGVFAPRAIDVFGIGLQDRAGLFAHGASGCS